MSKQDQFSKIYKDLLRDELKSVDLKKEKQEFIGEHFSPAPSTPWLVPVFGFSTLAIFAMIVAFIFPLSNFMPQSLVPGSDRAGNLISKQTIDAMKQAQRNGDLGVKVQRVSSEMGPVMVYRKTYQDAPITIVWVFPSTATIPAV